MRKIFISLFGIFASLVLLTVSPAFSFAQTVTPSQDAPQATTVAQDSSSSQTDAPTQTTLLTPNQQNYDNLSNPGLLPDSPFYFLKRWGENVQTFFTIDDYQRAQLQLHFAQVRLSEAKAELQKNNTNLTDQMLSDYNKNIQAVSNATQKLAAEGKEVTSLIDTVKDREQTRLAVLNKELTTTVDSTKRQQIQNAINFTTRQSQTNINRLVNALTNAPSYKPGANQTISGQVTVVSTPNFTVQTPNNKIFTFATDNTTVFKQYGSSGSASFTNLAVGTFVHVVFPRQTATTSGTPTPSVTSTPTPSTTTPLAKEVLIGVPQSLIVPLTGTIANFAQDSFTLQTATGGVYTIQVNMQTVFHSNRDDATAHAIQNGTMVRVYAVPQTAANTYLAKTIDVVLPKKLSRTGMVTAIQGSTITVVAKNQSSYTFTLTGNTIVQKNGQPDSSADLAVNQMVTVWYYGNPTDTTGTATDITIRVPRVSKVKVAFPLKGTNTTPTSTTTPVAATATTAASNH